MPNIPPAAAAGNVCSVDMERFGITVAGQTREWLLFVAVGVALGVWYDVFRIGRLFDRPTAWRAFLQDIAAAAGAAFITVFFALPISNGQIRFSSLLALLLGATAYYVTVGRLVYLVLRFAVRQGRRVGDAVAAKRKKMKRNCKIREKSLKKHLKHADDM